MERKVYTIKVMVETTPDKLNEVSAAISKAIEPIVDTKDKIYHAISHNE